MTKTVRSAFVGMVVLCAAAALAAPAARAGEADLSGVMVWNLDYWQTASLADFYGPNYEIEKLKPMKLVGARNGTFSAQVVLTNSNGSLREVKARVGELAAEGGAKIAADRIQVRYSALATAPKSWAPPYRFDALLDSPPDEVAPVEMKAVGAWRPKNEGPVATLAVWVTIRVPKDAAPGDYRGKLTIEVENAALKPLVVPIEMKVAGWVVPDPRDFTVRNMGWLSPEQVAGHYGVPMWSDKHFELMGKSLALAEQAGCRMATVNLVCRYHSQDNHETMVKWIKQPDGGFKYDFTVFDRYMDLVEKTIGKPFPVRLNMWSRQKNTDLPVLVLDPATGKTEELVQPPYGTPESLAFWKPVLDEIRVKMEKRKWVDVTAPNWHEYCGGPDPKIVSMYHKIWPDGKWVDMDHGRRTAFKGEEPGLSMPCLSQTTVWNEGGLDPYFKWDGQSSPGPRGFKGKLQPGVAFTGHGRDRFRDGSELWVLRMLDEEHIYRGHHGVDPIGIDLWPVKDKNGRYRPGQWAACALGPRNCTMAILAPGPDGAVATERFEALREGVQICEAILFLQRALDGGKLEKTLADRANKALDDRARAFAAAYKPANPKAHPSLNCKTIAEGAMERDAELFATAAEVAKAVGAEGVKPKP